MKNIMKNIFRFVSLFAAAALLFAGCQMTELDTDQYGPQGIVFSAFGPNPVMRGGEMTILGSNLENVKEVLLPGGISITNFTQVVPGLHGKLVFNIPVDGPEVGYIVIRDSSGNEAKSFAEVTYTEPIVFESFSPASAMPGDVISIKGDYLNLVQEVIFTDGVVVSANDFIEHSRYSLKVKVPSSAITGVINLGDADQTIDPDAFANKMPSSTELEIGDPSVEEAEEATYKAGDEITISGEYLDMIEKVVFQGAEVTDFTVSADGKTITLTLPDTATEGDITVVSYAGKEFKAGTIKTVVPTELKASPSPVKAGEELVISGKDLDLVTMVDLPGAPNMGFELKEDGSLALTMSVKATEGDVTLTLANGNVVTVPFTLVHPAVTAIEPVSLMAGEKITVKGTDLDLITKVTLGGKDEEFELSGEDLVISTTNTSVSGKIVLTLANGETVEPEDQITLSYDSFIITTSILPASAHIGELVIITGQNFNLVENIFIGNTKVTSYVSRTDTEIQFFMPYNKVGTYTLYYHLFSGDVEACPTQVEVLLEQNITVIWQGEEDMGSWSNQPYYAAETAFSDAGLQVGDKVRFYYSPYADWFQIQLFDGHWGALAIDELGGGQTISPDTVPNYTGYFEFTVTPALLAQLTSVQGWGGAMLSQGESAIVTMITMVHEIPQEKEMWSGNWDVAPWSNWEFGKGEGENNNFFIENPVSEGTELRIYCNRQDAATAWWQFQAFDGHWGALDLGFGNGNNVNESLYDLDANNGVIKIKLTAAQAEILNTTNDWGCCIIFQAENIAITKIATF